MKIRFLLRWLPGTLVCALVGWLAAILTFCVYLTPRSGTSLKEFAGAVLWFGPPLAPVFFVPWFVLLPLLCRFASMHRWRLLVCGVLGAGACAFCGFVAGVILGENPVILAALGIIPGACVGVFASLTRRVFGFDRDETATGTLHVKSRVPWLRPMVGSFVSACVGWIVALIGGYSLISLMYGSVPLSPEWLRDLPKFLGDYGGPFAVVVLPAWLVVLLPFYVWLPIDSRLWRVPFCTLACAFGGAFYSILLGDKPGWAWFGGLCGGAIGLFGSLTRNYFRAGGPPLRRSRS